MKYLFLDTETRSRVELKKTGVYRYAPECAVHVITWRYDGGPVQSWDVTRDVNLLQTFWNAVADPDTILVAHNAMFDRVVLRDCINRELFGCHQIPSTRWRCSMHLAMLHGLPAALGDLANVLGVQHRKREGKNLILQFCKPRLHKGIAKWANAATHPADWKAFVEYAEADTAALADVWAALPRYNYSREELQLYHWDQWVNDLGFRIDDDLRAALLKLLQESKEDIEFRLTELTDGAATTANQRDRLLQWCREQGVNLDNMQAETVSYLRQQSDTPPQVIEVLELREQGSKAAGSKLVAAGDRMSPDGRLRGGYQIAGAHTGRWAGRGFQPANLKRVGGWYEEEPYRATMIQAAMSGTWYEELDGTIQGATGNLLRSVITAEPGQYLCPVDLSNIEGRALAYLAGERWKVDAFRAYDEGRGPDLYVASYSQTFGVPVGQVSKAERQIGKVMELAFGYAGGAGAFLRFAGRKMDYAALVGRTMAVVDPALWERAEASTAYDVEQCRPVMLPDDQWTALHAIKLAWRDKHPATTVMWKEVAQAFGVAATQGGVVHVGQFLRFHYGRIFGHRPVLRIILPSGRSLSYYNPEAKRGRLSFRGVHPLSKKWWTLDTHGGRLVENIVQAFSRDIFVQGVLRADAQGVKIPMHTYDEIVGEGVPEIAEIIKGCMVAPVEWAPGFPLAAKAEEPHWRYGK